jgi:hypothetical protein
LSALRIVLLEADEEGSSREDAAGTGGSSHVLRGCQARLYVLPTSTFHDAEGWRPDRHRDSEDWEVDSGIVREALISGNYSPLRAFLEAVHVHNEA